MYLYFDNGGTLRTLIPHGEIPRQGNPLNLYLCFDEDRFDEESRQNFIIKIRFTFPDGTLSNEYTINPLQTDSNNNGYYLGLQQFEKLSDSEITFALKPGMEYHMFKYGFTGADRITTLYGKVLIHISFVYKEYDEEGNLLGKNVYEENGTFYIERTIGSNLKQSVITPDEYTELQNLINRYILEFNDITFITDVESLESVELPDIRHLYRVSNAEGKLEYYNYRYEKWHRFVTGDEFADLVAKNNNHEQRISILEPKVEDLEKKADNLQEQIYDEVDCREQEVDRLDKLIDDHEADVDLFKEDVGDRFSVVHNTLNEKINRDFSGLGVASSVHKEDTVIVRCAGCNGGPASTYTLTVGALTELINSEVDYFKGYHASLAALKTAHPTGEPGDYAFVATENDDQYHMYVWDEEEKPGRWEETISGQYALASSFETFQQDLIEGSIHVGAIKGNVENIPESSPSLLNIEINGNKYVLPSVALDFLGDAVDGAYKLGAIKINGDTWNINNDIIDLEISDENIEGAYELGSMIINGNKWNVLKTSFVEEKIEELRAYMEANNFNKGEFLSLEKLQEKHPEGKPGEFAFVNTPTDQGDVMLMYVWDEDANTWKETTSNQYVLTNVFENFKEETNEEINALWDDVDALWEKGGGGVETVEELPPAQIPDPYASATASSSSGEKLPVPTSGYVEKVYFDTSLSVEEVLEQIKVIPPISELGTPILITKYEDGTLPTVGITSTYVENPNTDGTLGKIAMIVNLSKYVEVILNSANYPSEEEAKAAMESTLYFCYFENMTNTLNISFNGWNPNFNGEIEINSELTNVLSVGALGPEFSNMPLYEDVEGLSELFYTKSNIPMIPNPDINQKVIYRVSGGEASTPVPNSGTVEKIYFNKNLTEEEVIAELDKLTYVDFSGMLISPLLLTENEIMVCAAKQTANTGEVVYMIFDLAGVLNNDQSKVYFMSNGLSDLQPYIGWNPDFSGEIEANSVAVSEMPGKDADGNDVVNPVGVENEKIANLFSLTPTFGSGGSTKYYNFDGENWNQLLTDKDKVDVDLDSIKIDVDEEMSDESINPVQNKVIKAYVDGIAATKQDVLTIDTKMSDESENLVQNKVIKTYMDTIIGEPLILKFNSFLKENANTLKSIEIGEDVWNIPQGNSLQLIDEFTGVDSENNMINFSNLSFEKDKVYYANIQHYCIPLFYDESSGSINADFITNFASTLYFMHLFYDDTVPNQIKLTGEALDGSEFPYLAALSVAKIYSL